MDDGRRHFLFGITVSEIAFILFFLLLLFSFFAIAKLEKENTAERTGREQAVADARKAEDTLKSIGEAFGYDAEVDEDDALKILAKGAEAIENSERQKQQLAELEQENEELREKDELASKKVEDTQGELGKTRGQLANLQKRAGVGDPPCWVVDESGDIEYLFKVTLFGDETVRVQREAPRHRDRDYQALPSIPEITSRRLKMEQFKTLSLPIYR